MKKSLVFLGIFALVLPLMFLGCGNDGAQGPQGIQGPPGADASTQAKPESCATCHNGDFARNGDAHQAAYDELFQDNVVVVSNLAYSNDNTNDTVTFNMTKAGDNFDCTQADSLGVYFVAYDNATRVFDNDNSARLSLVPTGATKTYDGSGGCTITAPQTALGNLDNVAGLIVVYGRDETIGSIPNSRVQQDKYPFAALLETGAGVDYASAANVSGCEKCHIVPYLKHGYIYGQVGHDNTTDFYTCKACHQDNGVGDHPDWQLAVTDPARWATFEDGVALTPAEEAQYAYRTRLMNDVHMSHAMEFAYPQSMSNCATCHEGKLTQILTDANFTAETCKSCHAVSGPGREKQAPSLQSLWDAAGVSSFHTATLTCNAGGCHVAGAGPKTFSQLHTGYDPIIYADAAGNKYSDAITVSIDNATYSDNTHILNFSFSASGTAGGLSSADIVPDILVGLYGYNTKDYIQGPHESDPLGSGNRALEWSPTASNSSPYITVNGGNVTVDLSQVPQWAGWIDNGTVRRVEIAILPALSNPALPDVAKEREGPPHGGTVNQDLVALNAPSRTFDLTTNAFVDNYFEGTNALVKVDGCNNCHGALAVGFHAPDRGGNIVACRLCHIVKNGASHLEMQSRSIDSYVHAIHSFQEFNISSVNFDNAVQSLEYTAHTESHFPTFGLEDCQACHNAGKFNVPDQSKSLPGVLSASADHATLVANGFTTRQIGDVPSYTTGPASRACGACHRAAFINEDDAGGLSSFNGHVENEGYLIEDGDIQTIIQEIFAQL